MQELIIASAVAQNDFLCITRVGFECWRRVGGGDEVPAMREKEDRGL